MANELSRVSDRLTRARQQSWNGATRAWLPPPARREPTPHELLEQQRDAAEEAKRPPTALVAIRVEVRHHNEPTPSAIDVQPVEFEDRDRFEAYVVEEPPARAVAQLPPPAAAASEPFVLLPAAAASSDGKSANKQTRAGGIFHYFAARALRAYLTHQRFVSPAAPEPRMLDLRA